MDTHTENEQMVDDKALDEELGSYVKRILKNAESVELAEDTRERAGRELRTLPKEFPTVTELVGEIDPESKHNSFTLVARLTSDRELLDQMREEVDSIATQLSQAVQMREFAVRKAEEVCNRYRDRIYAEIQHEEATAKKAIDERNQVIKHLESTIADLEAITSRHGVDITPKSKAKRNGKNGTDSSAA